MNRSQALELIQAFNSAAEYIPPLLTNRVAKTDAMKIVEGVANGSLVCEIKPVAPAPVQAATEAA